MSQSTLNIINKHIELSEKHLKQWEEISRRHPNESLNIAMVTILNRELNILSALRDVALELHGLVESRIVTGDVETQPDR